MEVLATLLWRDLCRPLALEGFPCSLDGNIDILFRGLLNFADDRFIGRVDGLELFAVNSLYEFIVDEAGRC